MENNFGALWYATDRDTGEKRRDKSGSVFFTGTIDSKKADILKSL